MDNIGEIPHSKEVSVPTREIFRNDNLRVLAFPIEHDSKTFEMSRHELEEAIKNSDGVIFEYFPQEIRQVMGYAKAVTNYREFMPFFEPVADLARKHEKDAYVFDPAFCNDFAWVRAKDAPASWVSAFITALVGANLIKERRTLSRRDFFKRLAIGSVTGAVGLKWAAIDSIIAENNTRQAGVAQAILDQAETPEETQRTLLMIYPPAHVTEINRFLKDDEARKSTLSKALGIFEGLQDIKTKLFTRRQYGWDGKEWKLKNSAPLSTLPRR